MPLDRIFRQTVRIDLAYPEAFANFAAPTAAELNNATLVKNITCALDEESTEFTLNDPDTDDSLSWCDPAGTQTATFKNPNVTLVAYRDADRSAAGIYALALSHLNSPDNPLIAILRVGLPYGTAYATNQFIRMVGGKTDLPVNVEENGSNARISNTLLPDGTVNWNYKIAS